MKLTKSIVLQKLGEDFVAYDLHRSVMHELNETAYDIVRMISKGKSKKAISEYMSKKYDIPQQDSLADVDELTAILKQKGIVES